MADPRLSERLREAIEDAVVRRLQGEPGAVMLDIDTAKDAARLAELTTALIAKLDAVHADPRYEGVWRQAQMMLGPYNGPQYIDELNAVRALLAFDLSGGSQTGRDR